MLKDKKIAVVVPAYNEETQIRLVLDSMPDFVDRIIVVNDCSTDQTENVVKEIIEKLPSHSLKLSPETSPRKTRYNEADIIGFELDREAEKSQIPSVVVNPGNDQRIVLINNSKTGGVGASIARGYLWCKMHQIDCTAVMAGDGQMDPEELLKICQPVIDGEVDYSKGNRIIHRSAWSVVPKIRFIGNSLLSILTKISSGYWRVSDPQCGFTAISLRALGVIPIHKIYKSYGMPNDLLVKLNIALCTIKEIDIKPIYRVGEKSKMKIFLVIPRISFLLMRSFLKRLWVKYLLRDFHPLFILYHLSFFAGICIVPYFIKISRIALRGQVTSYETLLFFLFLFISGSQALLFAMWMDIQDNDRLQKN